jgi:hypothetical protein
MAHRFESPQENSFGMVFYEQHRPNKTERAKMPKMDSHAM